MFSKLPPTVLLSLSALFWGGNFVVGRWVHAFIPPLGLTFWRWAIAGLLLLPFVYKDIWVHRRLIRQNMPLLVALAVLGMVIFHAFTYIALATTTAINATFVLAAMPMVIPMVSFVAGEDRLTARQSIGIAISILGVVTIISRGQWDILIDLRFSPGDLWILGAVLAWSIYSVLLKRKPNDLPPLVLLGATIFIAIIILAPFYIWEWGQKGAFVLNLTNTLVILYLALFSSLAAFICWNTGVARIGANKAGLFIHLIPLCASILSIVFLGETLETYHLVGMALILLGIYLTTTAQKKRTVAGVKGDER